MKSGHGDKMAANDNWPNAIKQSCAEGKTHVVDHEVHDGLGHEVADRLVDDGHVGVHQVADGLHLPLQLGVAVHEVVGAVLLPTLALEGEGGGGGGGAEGEGWFSQ